MVNTLDKGKLENRYEISTEITPEVAASVDTARGLGRAIGSVGMSSDLVSTEPEPINPSLLAPNFGQVELPDFLMP